ncbi:MAG: S-methyl-5-thioribose-1-phosphate isomerase [Theionarchaea archaeon]|nr:S-methyl-5-thioribose-1-phosphate isomerase [Theionarchaea archaeon]
MQDDKIEYLDDWNVPLTIWWNEERKTVKLIDQTLLPNEVKVIECDNWRDIREAIRVLRIRGAPAIGAAGAYALTVEAQRFEGDKEGFFAKMKEVKRIIEVRPTAVNLKWAVERVLNKLDENQEKTVEELKEITLREAKNIVDEDINANKQIGKFGLKIFKEREPKNGNTFKLLTHCHAGSLATSGYGTVFGVIRSAFENEIELHVFVDETRPLLQGARITAWELKREGIPVTLITDNSAGWVMKKENIDIIIVGADRIATNGDTANKVGTYSLSILAKEHGIPFYVAAPISTIDREMKSGDEIVIEERYYGEVTHIHGAGIATYLSEKEVKNYAFDVTPHDNIKGIITEKGILTEPYTENIKKIVLEAVMIQKN